jgi:hypothetical protein
MKCPEQLWGPPSLLLNGYMGASNVGVKLLGHKAYHSFPSSAMVRDAQSYTSTPSHAFML